MLTVLGVTLLPGTEKACRVIVPDNQLSLAIGNKGQNAKLAARLTGYKIDIRSESSPAPEDEEPEELLVPVDENEELLQPESSPEALEELDEEAAPAQEAEQTPAE